MSVIGHGVEIVTSGTRPASPFDGMQIYETDTRKMLVYNGSAWVEVFDIDNGGSNPIMRNVQSTVLTSATTQATNSTYADVTGLTVSITPSSSSSKVLVMAAPVIGNDPGFSANFIALARGGTIILRGDSAGSRTRAVMAANIDTGTAYSQPIIYLDSPNTTSSTTYSVQVASTGGTAYINRSQDDTDSNYRGRYASTITVMEIPV